MALAHQHAIKVPRVHNTNPPGPVNQSTYTTSQGTHYRVRITLPRAWPKSRTSEQTEQVRSDPATRDPERARNHTRGRYRRHTTPRLPRRLLRRPPGEPVGVGSGLLAAVARSGFSASFTHAARFLFGILLVAALHFTPSTDNQRSPVPLSTPLPTAFLGFWLPLQHTTPVVRLPTTHLARLSSPSTRHSLLLLFFPFYPPSIHSSSDSSLLRLSQPFVSFFFTPTDRHSHFAAVFDSLRHNSHSDSSIALLPTFPGKEAALLDNPLNRTIRLRDSEHKPFHPPNHC